MEEIFSKKYLMGLGVFSVVIVAFVVSRLVFSSETKVVFCDVGNGDGIYIRTAQGTDVVIDAGQSRDMLACIGREMPIFDRTIEVAIITHPHIDHYGGFVYLLDAYEIKSIIVNEQGSDAQTYQLLLDKIVKEGASVIHPKLNDQIDLDTTTKITVVWPWTTSIAVSNSEVNALSIVVLYEEGATDILFTGDATPDVLTQIQAKRILDGQEIEILKVPHHGSEEGLTPEFLEYADPELSVISVGSNNSYGHPSPKVIDMFRDSNRSFLITSEEGDIRVKIHPDGTFSL